MAYHPKVHRCEHIKTNGTQCKSPSLSGQIYCYFHARWREHRVQINTPNSKFNTAIEMPVLEDANAIQVALMQVTNLMLNGLIEPKIASLALYSLQIASSNLKRTYFEAYPHDVVINLATVDKSRMGEELWQNTDFNPKPAVKAQEPEAVKLKVQETEPIEMQENNSVKVQVQETEKFAVQVQEKEKEKDTDKQKLSARERFAGATPELIRAFEIASEAEGFVDKPPDMKELRGRITAMIRDSVARHPELVAAYDSRKK